MSVVLLSGGSSNIGWLEKLIERDFEAELSHADILKVDDYQEVVAKGLAVECARRFFEDEGDFSSVTYNRLCLVLDVNEEGATPRMFRPKVDGMPSTENIPGVLLPSASVLRRFVDQPMRWRVQVGKEPKRLDYYFLNSSFDPEDHENRYNMEDHTARAPSRCAFDATLLVELMVRADGTAIPRFVFKTGQSTGDQIAAEGRPFYMDMTCNQQDGSARAYIGLDFGTSNSSVSFVDERSVQVFKRRSSEAGWLELSELSQTLPFPLAAPLASYYGQSDARSLVRSGREFIEAALALARIIHERRCGSSSSRRSGLWKARGEVEGATCGCATLSVRAHEAATAV